MKCIICGEENNKPVCSKCMDEVSYIRKENRPDYYKLYAEAIEDGSLTEHEKLRLNGLMIGALAGDYEFFKANEIAEGICKIANLPWKTSTALIDFYTKTRRYDVAEELLNRARENATGEVSEINSLAACENDINKRRAAANDGKKEYMPNQEQGITNYAEFMASLGIDITRPVKVPKAIPDSEYPEVVFTDNPNFDSFVAYDLETTGLKSREDCIIEIGAVKVINGKIVDSKEFVFDEFVRPYKKSVKEEITKLTGIKPEDVKDARPMWEVIPDFMKFAGDLPLVGYNNYVFDSKFLRRAGRYSRLIISNTQFDVLKYAREMRKIGNIDSDNTKLGTVASILGIENPAAHRAWADALVTAKVYMKLKEM